MPGTSTITASTTWAWIAARSPSRIHSAAARCFATRTICPTIGKLRAGSRRRSPIATSSSSTISKNGKSKKIKSRRLGLRHVWDNMSLELSASALVDPFFTQTQNLPRLDHYWLGQPLLNDTLTWYEHTNSATCGRTSSTQPTDPTDLAQFHFLPYDVDRQGRTAGHAAGNRLAVPTRARSKSSPTLWANWPIGAKISTAIVFSALTARSASARPCRCGRSIRRSQSDLFNVNGIAHKVVFGCDFSYTDASKDLNQLVIYDEIDDNNIQALRAVDWASKSTTIPAAGPTPFPFPPQFDERFYAVRRGMMDWVTGPTEIADDLTVVRLGLDQRWQTKRGIPGQQHIIDWITLDTNMEIVPQAGSKLQSNGRHVRLRLPLVCRRPAHAAFVTAVSISSTMASAGTRPADFLAGRRAAVCTSA